MAHGGMAHGASERAGASGTAGTERAEPRALRASVELGLGLLVATWWAVRVYPGSDHPWTIQLCLAIALAAASWLVESVEVPMGLDRAGRVQNRNAANALLLPAAILLPPGLFIPLAALGEIRRFPATGWRKSVANTALRIEKMCAAAIAFHSVAAGTELIADAGPPLAYVAALVAAGVTMLVVESVTVGRFVRVVEGLLPVDLPLLEPRQLVQDSPDVAIGALGCVLLATSPIALVLLLPLLLLQRQTLVAQAAVLSGHRDPKTGLLTLATFLDLTRREVARARRTSDPVSLLMLDLDGLRAVNSTFGHMAGDRCIDAMARVLEQVCREEDLIARFGGDEFCLLIPGADLTMATTVAERIRATAERTAVEVQDGRVDLATSIGVTTAGPEDDVDSLLARADLGLREAKAEGRNRVRVQPPTRRKAA